MANSLSLMEIRVVYESCSSCVFKRVMREEWAVPSMVGQMIPIVWDFFETRLLAAAFG